MNEPRLKRDWEGRYVRLLREVKNYGGDVVPAGAVMLVKRNYGGLDISRIAYCECCSVGTRIVVRKVSEHDVELLPKDTDISALLSTSLTIREAGMKRTISDLEKTIMELMSTRQSLSA